jgi:hypothetical protein
MSGLRPIGSEKLEGMDKIKRIMEIARYKENKPSNINENESTEYNISLSDGNRYQIVKEKLGYIIKRSINESVSDYIEPMKNRKYYPSYSQALKRLNLMAKEFNMLYENSEGTSLFSEQKKKFKLKLPKGKKSEPTPTDVPPVPSEPIVPPTPMGDTPPPVPMTLPPAGGNEPSFGAPPPDMGGGGEEPGFGTPPPDMGGGETPPTGEEPGMEMGGNPPSDASDTYDDMGSTSGSDGYDDDMGSKKDGKVSMKLIQKLIGKSAQKIRSYISKDEMDSNDTKYIINSILSALDLTVLDEEDVEEIITRIEGVDEDEDMEFGDEEDIDFGDEEGEEAPKEKPEMGGEMAEKYDSYPEAFNDYMGGSYSTQLMNELDDDFEGEDVIDFEEEEDDYPRHGSRQKIRRYPSEKFEPMFESIIDKVIKSHINENEIKQSKSENVTKTKEKIVRLSESIKQERSALKFLENNPKSFLVGSTSKGNLLFKTGLKENKITPDGKII